MKPSEQARQAGLDGLRELSAISGQSVQTLINWHRSKPQLFEIVCVGSAMLRKQPQKEAQA